jgi:type I restriction enzyme S subunit
MELRAGYKKTELGLIPEDWNIKTISEISKPVRGGSPRPAGDPKYFNGNFIPWLTVAALTNISLSEIYVSETSGYLTEEGSHHSRILEKETLIIANSGATLGVAKLLAIKCCANDGIAALFDFDKETSKLYLAYFINTQIKYLREVVATGNGQPNLNTGLIGNIQVPFPPTLEEQTAIANALSDTDSLIKGLEKIIIKKRNIKQGAMQKLLQPKESWEVKKLGDVVNIRKGQIITESATVFGYIPVIAGGKTPAYYHNKPNRLGKTITISGSGANAGFVSFHDYPIFASDCSTIEEHKDYSIEYVFNLLQLLQEKIYNMQTGGAQPHIHPSDLNPIEVSFPKKEIQENIAKIISEMNSEIIALETKLEKYKKLRLGMSQNLLTGKIRLI